MFTLTVLFLKFLLSPHVFRLSVCLIPCALLYTILLSILLSYLSGVHLLLLVLVILIVLLIAQRKFKMKYSFVPKCFQCGYSLALSIVFSDLFTQVVIPNNVPCFSDFKHGSKSKTVTCPRCGVENVR